MKKIAAILMTASLACMLPHGGMYAQEPASETVQEPASETVQEAAPEMTEAATEAEEYTEVPKNRPEYRALDYVKMNDDEYKKISIRLYPPADDSEEAKTEYQTNVDTMIMTQLFSLYPIEEMPKDLMRYTVGSLTETYRQYAQMYGMDFDSFLQTYLQQDETTFNAQVEKAAEKTLKEELLLKAVAEKENITISDEEYEKGCEDYAVRYGYLSADALRQAFDEPTIRISLLMDKTFAYLEDVSQIDLIIETETESETETGAMTEAETEAAPQ